MLMKRSKQQGVALIFAMIFVLVLSIMAASLMFLSQSETWASMNYRLMTQSRYGAEAGLHAAANYLMTSYTAPGMPGGDAVAGYNVAVSPVTLIAGTTPIVLGPTMNGLSPNYPVPGTLTNFKKATQQSLTAGNTNVNYSVSAELLSMRQVIPCGGVQPVTAQLWKLTSHGDINGARNSEVEVSALLESHITPCYNFAAYALASGCNSIQFTGNGTVDSYDSRTGTALSQFMGNLGSNGNLNTANNTVVSGTFASPDQGVGSCASGAVDALSGGGTVSGCGTGPTNCVPSPGLVKLSQIVNPLPPSIPSTVPPPSPNVISTTTLTPCYGTACPINGPGNGNYGDITLSGNDIATLTPYEDPVTHVCSGGIYYINSITLTGNGTLKVAPCSGTSTTPGTYQPLVVDIVGQNTTTPLTLTGNGINNPSMSASVLQIQYNGANPLTLTGNGASAAVVFAPNAQVNFSGNGAWWGSIIGKQVTSNGNGAIHYDRALQANLATLGNWTLDTFTWSKY
jgi:Tfp pilus assembly protein PilX